MKNALLFFLMLGLVSVESKGPIRALTAEIDQIKIDTNSTLSGLKFERGDLEINFVENKLSIFLYTSLNCPDGMNCPQEPEIHLLETDFNSWEVSECGDVVYRGDIFSENGRNVETITVFDQRGNYCLSEAPKQKTKIFYSVFQKRFLVWRLLNENSFSGNELVPELL